ncbi:hypothetical protein [Streptomyces sp. NBC_01262]|uniref:hypothetical protein n=1 Tax=Streptomyces sp. NBC_01262 TaxID=2903803 RepID=UPI002E317143|nr:hypothetical protein [Streptomyces sp. NBC_01262]
MADLQTPITVSTTSPLFRVSVNDGGPDGGSSADVYIGGIPSSMDVSHMETAVLALAASLGSVGTFNILSVTRVTPAETAL